MQPKLYTLIIFILLAFSSPGQARLTIVNNSLCDMTVKVKQGHGKGTIYETVNISPNNRETVTFYSSGNYFTKTKAVIFRPSGVFTAHSIINKALV